MIEPGMIDIAQADIDESLRIFSLTSLPTAKDLKRRYRNLIKQHHPDHNPDNLQWCNSMVAKLNQAYRILGSCLERSAPTGDTTGDASETPSVEDIIRKGDEALRDSVINGCLHRSTRNVLAKPLLDTVERMRITLGRFLYTESQVEVILFFHRLFGLFLKAAHPKTPHSLPGTWNSTRFFRHLALANRYMDKALRSFYHHLKNHRLSVFANIPLSLLADSETFYRFILRDIRDAGSYEAVKSRLELIDIYRQRISDSRFWLP
jgi:hypothetical protein